MTYAVAEHCRPVLADSEAILNALPNPVLLVALRTASIVDANMAAESFFEISTQFLRRQSLKELVPFGSPLLALIDQVRANRAHPSTNTRSISARPASVATVRSIFTSRR